MAIDTTFLIVTTSLIVQLAVLVLLVLGYWFKRQLKFRTHGIIMTTALIVHLTVIFAVMLPSFVLALLPAYIFTNPLEAASIVGLIHGILGASAATLGIWRVTNWRFRKDLAGCFNKKKYMLTTMIVWLTALGFGIALYTLFNWATLVG